MKRGCLFLALIGLFSCQTLPGIHPVADPSSPEIREKCVAIFPDGKWQFVHSIEATLAGEQKGFMIGVTRIQRMPEKIRCIMMTVEGFVLFDAEYDQKLVIHRAVAPFDAIDFARGVIADIRLMFLPPRGLLVESGRLKNGIHDCRYQNKEIGTVDVQSGFGDRWEIHQYNDSHKLMRSIVAFLDAGSTVSSAHSIPIRLELTAHGRYGYSLLMDLIEARPLAK